MVAGLKRPDNPGTLEACFHLPTSLCVHEAFDRLATASPRAVALRFEGQTLTYRQLSAQSSKLAARLRSLGVRRGANVAIYAPRSLETIISLLAILKAGAAYVALDMESPASRIRLMLEAAEPALILTLPPLAGDLRSTRSPIAFLNEEIHLFDDSAGADLPEGEERVAPGDLAYIAFTSGTSGKPKGVCVTHEAVVRFAMSRDFLVARREDTFLQFAPISFDASTFEIWCPLLNGASIAIFPPWKPSLTDLGEFIDQQRVSVLWLSAPLFHMMTDNHLRYLAKVRLLFTGGDVVSVAHARKAMEALPHCKIINAYGPTENTTFTCCQPITEIPAEAQSIPIGRPVAEAECTVLDENLNAVPDGQPGELFIGGPRLAAGYLRDPNLTREKFIWHPNDDVLAGNRLYRSGDKVRRLPDGSFEFLGRMDRQLKILGFRVELLEIENVLRQHPAVCECVVVPNRMATGCETLFAAIVGRAGENATASELRLFARERLPQVMVPAEFIFLDALPLNSNGKIDHAGMAALSSSVVHHPVIVPDHADPTVAKIARIWSAVLGRPDISPTDNFFDLGGNSLRAAYLLARIRAEFRRTIPIITFFSHPTPGGLANLLTTQQPLPAGFLARHGAAKAEPKPAIFCIPGQGGEMTAYQNLAQHFAPERTVYGLRTPDFTAAPQPLTVEKIAIAHVETIRALQPAGPYHLFGYCFGGLVAFETARQLHAAGAQPGFVGIFHFDIHDLPATPFSFLNPAAVPRFVSNSILGVAECFHLAPAERYTAIMRVLYRVLAMPRDCHDAALPKTPEERLTELHELAWPRYQPRAFPHTITLLRPRRLPLFKPDPHLGWSSKIGQPLEVRIVPGPGIHGAAIMPENAAATAKIIEEAVDEFEARDAVQN
jgi:amino acid adenylation domain-containing protein